MAQGHAILLVEIDLPAGGGADGVEVESKAPVLAEPDDVAMVLHTSGTTARPKGVVITHAAMLYGAEVMVHPARQGTGVGKCLYEARRALTIRLGLLRIRAGARLRF